MSSTVNFRDLVLEAEKRESRKKVNNEAFVMELEDGETVSIPYPDALTYMAYSKIPDGDIIEQIRCLFGKNVVDFNRFIEALAGQPVSIIEVVVERIWKFWGLQDTNPKGFKN